MDTDELNRWPEISRRLDEALDLDEAARAAWLNELEGQDPTIGKAVRSMLADREHLAEEPLLADERVAIRPRQSLSGQRIGAYTLDRVLGHGGMGTVWLAHRSDGRYEGRAAIKFLNASLLGRPTEQRFVREGSVLARLRHPSIAQLTDAGIAATGQPYLVLEYVEGQQIDRYVQDRNLDLNARLRLFLDVVDAVAHAHGHLIVHRDIKPSNILVTSDGGVKLLDFGVAALLGADETGLTREMDPGLTPGYAAPEQILREPVTTATDVYSLGVVLFLLLTGKHPLNPDGKSAIKVAQETIEGETPYPSQCVEERTLARLLRGDLDTIVWKALKREPAERYQSAEALGKDIRNFLAMEPIAAHPDSFTYRARKFVSRHRGAVAAGVAIAAVLIAATVITTWQMLEAREQRDAALYQSQRAEFQARFAYQIMSQVGADGRPITIRELMERGVEALEKNHSDDPRFVIGMLVNISGRYMDLGDTNGEYDALVRAEAIARRLGDPERIAYVQCNTVETELALGRRDRARERLQDGLAHLARLMEPSFERRSECEFAQARLLWAEGKAPEAIDTARRLAEFMEATNRTDDLLYTSLASLLDVMLSSEGRRNEARDWNRRLIALFERTGEASGLGMSAARHNEAGHLYDAGEIAAALTAQRKIVEPLAGQEGADNMPARYAHRLGLYQVRVEGSDAGLVWLDRAIAIAASNNDRAAHIDALLGRARAFFWLGRWDNARADLEAAERLAADSTDEYRRFVRIAVLLRADLAIAQGEPERAIALIDDLLADVGYPQKRVANQLPLMVISKARAELALGRAAALQTAKDALALAEANAPDPNKSAVVGEALLVLAQAQRAMGDREGSLASAKRAASALAAGLTPKHSETQAALAFAADNTKRG